MHMPVRTLVLAACIACVAAPLAAAPRANDPLILSSATFLNSHPDLRWRVEGMHAQERRDHALAHAYFRRAAKYADKPSQALVAEALWEGRGVERDPAAAYAWMDLAAERGYVVFAARREHFWSRLDADQRKRALALGADVYARFGDDVAKPRLEKALVQAARKVVGSRTGFVGNVQVRLPGPGFWETVTGDQFFDERFWRPEKYWEWQDTTWRPVRTGRGTASDLQSGDDAPKTPQRADEPDR